jgi:ribose transport system ATP-binding protein
MPALEMRQISKRFPGVTALDSVNLDVFPSEVVALIGENGAGKSTLMKILGGVCRPDGGEIIIDGKPVTIQSVRDAARYGIGFIHQELHLLDNLDIAANVFLGREPTRGGPLRLIHRKAMEAESERHLRRFGLEISPRTLVRRLSLAQQQLVEIAKAASCNARILIMDEPTSCLTPHETGGLFEVIADLRSSGVSIIYISHRLSEIVKIADRVIALRDGRNAGTLERNSITHDNMVRLMVGRELVDHQAKREKSDGRTGLEIRNLSTRRFPTAEVSLSVRHGEVLGIAGLIGSGRTELAQTLFGIDSMVSGQILIDGVPVSIRSPRDAIAVGMFLAPEDRRIAGLISGMNIRENVTLPNLKTFTSMGIVRREREAATAEKMRDRLGIKAASMETLVSNLSGGNQQKVVLAKWLAMNPKVIIFDEPTRGIDIAAKAEVYRLMHELAGRGVAIVMISSEMEEILGNSDRVAVMHDGRITGVLDRAQCSEETLMRLAVA